MSNRRIAATFVIVVAAIFFVSGLRFVSGVVYHHGPAICGPLGVGAVLGPYRIRG